jgi:uncharacterized protein involved in exopolysaccharide biosynthesis
MKRQPLAAFDLTKFVTVPEVPIVVSFDKAAQTVIIGAVLTLAAGAIVTALIATR